MTHSVPTAFKCSGYGIGHAWFTKDEICIGSPEQPSSRGAVWSGIFAFIWKLGQICPDNQLEDFILEMFEKEQKNKYQ